MGFSSLCRCKIRHKPNSYVTEYYNARELNGISTEFGSVSAVNVRFENIYYIYINYIFIIKIRKLYPTHECTIVIVFVQLVVVRYDTCPQCT